MKTALILLVCSLIVSCQSADKKSPESWSGQMQNMSEDIQLLIPYVYNEKSYTDPKNEGVIKRALSDLSSQSHKIPEKMGKEFLGDDPILSYSLGNLQGDLKRAHHAFESGQKSYSRTVLKSSVGHCFRCHSLTTIGSDAKWDVSDFSNLELNPEERLELLVAARKYNEAFKFVEAEMTKTGFLKENAFGFENFLRKYLALSIRLNEDKAKTLEDLNRVLAHQKLPPYLEKQVKAWRDSLEKWPNHGTKRKKPLSFAQKKMVEAKRLQEFAYDHAGDVEYMQASEALHQALQSKKLSPSDEAEAYFLLGLCYEVLDDLGSYGLHETYFEACITKAPKSKLAKRCYKNLEASVIQGFSGSGGVAVPADEKKRLDHFKKLSR